MSEKTYSNKGRRRIIGFEKEMAPKQGGTKFWFDHGTI
jgi:hypothetical protein